MRRPSIESAHVAEVGWEEMVKIASLLLIAAVSPAPVDEARLFFLFSVSPAGGGCAREMNRCYMTCPACMLASPCSTLTLPALYA